MVSPEQRAELGRFLRDRRARLQPAAAGLAAGPRRRVAGLRREEVATLSGVGVTWYTMLESGAEMNVSQGTLEAIVAALHLSEDEREYAFALAFGGPPEYPDLAPDALAVATIEALALPAYVCSSQWVVLAWNAAFTRLWNIEPPGGPAFNIVSRMWSPEIRAMHGEHFTGFAARVVAMVRVGTGKRHGDPVYHALYAELCGDAVFAEAWASYDIATPLGAGRTTIDSPSAGRFTYEALTLPLSLTKGQSIVVQVPDAESRARFLTPPHL